MQSTIMVIRQETLVRVLTSLESSDDALIPNQIASRCELHSLIHLGLDENDDS
jgi:hypothetical protein